MKCPLFNTVISWSRAAKRSQDKFAILQKLETMIALKQSKFGNPVLGFYRLKDLWSRRRWRNSRYHPPKDQSTHLNHWLSWGYWKLGPPLHAPLVDACGSGPPVEPVTAYSYFNQSTDPDSKSFKPTDIHLTVPTGYPMPDIGCSTIARSCPYRTSSRISFSRLEKQWHKP